MFKNKIIRYSTFAMILAIVAYFLIETFSPQKNVPGIVYNEELNPSTYADLLEDERIDLQKWFRTSDESPIEDQASFAGLTFFEPDLNYRVVARVVPYSGDDKILEVQNTDGTSETYERFANLRFDLNGSPQVLLLLKHEGVLSLMWKDGTSGKTTYGGGRYLDFTTSDVKKGQLVVDFNKAYNPYCAYSPKYACPLPPHENTLNESIHAGEKYTPEK
jgi:uncharacterized protein (DUF1684 family)